MQKTNLSPYLLRIPSDLSIHNIFLHIILQLYFLQTVWFNYPYKSATNFIYLKTESKSMQRKKNI